MKKKDYLRIDESVENYMQSLSKQRDFAVAKKMGAFALGENLYNCGYDCDDFIIDLIGCFLTPKKYVDVFYDQLKDKYANVSKFPDVNTLIKFATNTNYIENLRFGYDRAKRIANIKKR